MNFKMFDTIRELEIAKLEEGDGIAATSIKQIKQNAKCIWHKTWSNMFNNLKLQQAEKRKSLLPTKFTGNSFGRTSSVRSCWFFCGDASYRYSSPSLNI